MLHMLFIGGAHRLVDAAHWAVNRVYLATQIGRLSDEDVKAGGNGGMKIVAVALTDKQLREMAPAHRQVFEDGARIAETFQQMRQVGHG